MWITIIAAVAAVVVGLVVLWPSHTSLQDPALVGGEQLLDAHVASSRITTCSTSTATDPQECVVSELRVPAAPAPAGPRGSGGSVAPTPTLEQPYAENGPRLRGGDDIQVVATRLPDGTVNYSFYDYRRAGSLVVLVVLFGLVVIAVGRWRGFGALVGMAISLAVLVAFLLPALLDGRDPVGVAVVGAGMIAFFALSCAPPNRRWAMQHYSRQPATSDVTTSRPPSTRSCWPTPARRYRCSCCSPEHANP